MSHCRRAAGSESSPLPSDGRGEKTEGGHGWFYGGLSSRGWFAGLGLKAGEDEPSPHPNPLPSHRMGAEREQEADTSCATEVCRATAG
jgi:hypothetical protein